ncbi:carboxypeptidase-like regulatory domain-containing protein [Dysgonomonas sp. 25]|uniref:carboxypeptidase-like regulatory domain-containing protein n=1 Tax=Dysgonomonas sp. 25 TaxID=2302933 RepID=UPI0013CFC4BE|nr:carboxypeptidase-like regulatory domain-containing protein [Dysgonomonas sp. 25]NDV70241.1 hypothetical protein [Dysgonomonas sp. 25]
MNTNGQTHRFVFLAVLFFLAFQLKGQTIDWKSYPGKTFVYEISNKEAEKLLRSKPQDSLMLKMLHTPLTSYKNEWEDHPKQGHFIFSEIHKNRVSYRYAPIMPFQVFLFKEYGVLTLQVVDAEGNIRSDAKVRIKGRWKFFDTGVYFDKVSQTYTIDDESEKTDRLLTVELDKFMVMFNLSKYLVNPSWYDNDNEDSGPDFYSYMLTDKNKYKPGETVRFKSYALSAKRKPLKEPLQVWLNNKLIKEISPYNPGGYADEVFLHDSLKLQLDYYYGYNIQLREKKGRVVGNTRFKYEDYELYDSRLETKLTAFDHYNPDTNRLEIKALDTNGLFLQDMKAEVLVTRSSVGASFTDLLVLPDVLMQKTINLDNDKPTYIDIPPSLFGESNCSYNVQIKAYTYDNQVLTSRNGATFYKSKYDIYQSTRNDTIRFEFEELGHKKNVKAKLWYNDDYENQKEIELPYEEPFKQSLYDYNIRVEEPSCFRSFAVSAMHSKLDIAGGIMTDSFNVKLENPLKLDVSWYIYQGNTLLEKGSGKEFDFKYPNTNLELTHYVEVFYFLGQEQEAFRRTFVPKTEFLDVDIDLPERIYPGQKLDATITVKDNMGKPVKGVDLTAFAFNSQLGYYLPDLPYYGPSPRAREQRSSYGLNQRNARDFTIPLNYPEWKYKAGLDTMKYYQFTYPLGKLFRHEVATPDSTTQFAPYVMKGGEAVQIYAIELNSNPIYFSWTEQAKRYSFVIPNDTVKQKITMRLHDRAVVIDSVYFTPHKKTILSVDLDSLPAYNAWSVGIDTRTSIDKDYKLTSEEKRVYSYYISRIPVQRNYNFTYLRDTARNIVYPVFHKCLQSPMSSVLIGPIPGGKRYMQYCDSTIYKHEGGFRYDYEDNVVYKYAIEPYPDKLTFSSTTNFYGLNDFTLTTKEFNRIVEACKNETDNWRPTNIQILQSGFHANFKLPTRQDTTGVSNLLLRNVETKKLLYPDQIEYGQRKYSSVPAATYDAILLYNSGNYICFDSVPLLSGHYIAVDMTNLPLQPKDTLSQKWLALRTRVVQPYTAQQTSNYQSSYYSQPMVRRPSSAANAVRGIVKDDEGEPLIGVTVYIKGTTYGTVSDIDGGFEIAVDGNEATLVFSYIGYNTEELKVTKGSIIDVVLKADMQRLDEVVVIGYGTVRKSSLTGSVSSISVSEAIATEAAAPPEVPDDDEEGDNENEVQAAEDRLYSELLQLNGLRSNFSDVGFWEPALVTDKKGKARFTVTFPDNITQWNTIVYAMNPKLKTGTARKHIKSYKPLMAELKNPHFLVVGDSSYYAGNIRNYTYGKQDIEGLVTFAIEEDTVMSKSIQFTTSHQDKVLVTPTVADSLSATYMFRRNDGYNDGEKRTIPVLRQGTELAEGTLDFLRNGDRKEVVAAPDEEMHISISAKQLDVYMEAASYLRNYKYDCNEQLASKLIGFLNYRLYCQYADKKFKDDKHVNRIIKRLEENRNENKLWSWWGRSSSTSFWMSAHVIRALNEAKKAGYQVTVDLSRTAQDYTDTQRYRRASIYDMDIINALSDAGTEQKYDQIIDLFDKEIKHLEYVADTLARYYKRPNTTSYLKEKLQLLELRQKHNIGYTPDSLTKYLKKDVLGAVYCSDGKQRYWYSDDMMTTVIAYRIARNDSTLAHLKEPMQMYILGTKGSGWNTYQASTATMAILPDLMAESASKKTPSSVLLSGKDNKQLTEFPYETTLLPNERLTIEKQTGLPLIYSAYKMKWVTEENKGDAFEIRTSLGAGDTLTAGVPAILTVTLEVKQKNAEHVMIEVPIPAGCSYNSKRQNYWWSNRETHRESFKDKTVIFCESLPMGTYTFQIDLLPRYTGRYILNPAKAEMMYFPVVNANNDLRRIGIEERE